MNNPTDRFWSKVEKTDTCWLWRGAIRRDQYGAVKFNGRTRLAHRVAYELSQGPIPDGMRICHTCDVPACCNPAHLFAGTAKDNSDDMIRKGRARHYMPSGEANHQAKLTSANVQQIRSMYATGDYRYKDIAERFLTSEKYVAKIVRGERWA